MTKHEIDETQEYAYKLIDRLNRHKLHMKWYWRIKWLRALTSGAAKFVKYQAYSIEKSNKAKCKLPSDTGQNTGKVVIVQ